MLRAQRRRETVTEGGWADLPDELVAKVLEMLQAAGRTEPQAEALGSPAVRVCAVEGRV